MGTLYSYIYGVGVRARFYMGFLSCLNRRACLFTTGALFLPRVAERVYCVREIGGGSERGASHVYIAPTSSGGGSGAAVFCLPTIGPSSESNREPRVKSKPHLRLQPKGTAQGTSETLDPGLGLIKLDVVVTDASGTPIPGLPLRDFTVLDNGEPSRILSFQAFDGVSAKPEPSG